MPSENGPEHFEYNEIKVSQKGLGTLRMRLIRDGILSIVLTFFGTMIYLSGLFPFFVGMVIMVAWIFVVLNFLFKASTGTSFIQMIHFNAKRQKNWKQ